MEHVDPNEGAPATFEITDRPDGATVVTIEGELDMSSTGRLESEVGRALANGPPRLIVDVGGVRFADSSALALWVRWAASVPQFELRDPPPLLRNVIERMGLAGTLGVAG